MTVCVSVKVSEGLVLAADSTAAIQGNLQDPKGQIAQGILKTYDHVRKLSHIKDYPIGTLTWGSALIGSRSVESLIKEYEHDLPSLEEEREKIKTARMQTGKSDTWDYNVQQIAEGLLKHVKDFYTATFDGLPKEKLPFLGILVSGYSFGNFFPNQWLIELPISNELKEVRPDIEEKPDFGATWYGLTDAIVRLHWGRDDAVLEIMAKHLGKSPEEIRKILDPIQYPVLFDGMPIQDAIDYAVYLVNVVIGRYRFVIGAPLCGGEIDVAVITPTAFTWIQRKSWNIKATSAI